MYLASLAIRGGLDFFFFFFFFFLFFWGGGGPPFFFFSKLFKQPRSILRQFTEDFAEIRSVLRNER